MASTVAPGAKERRVVLLHYWASQVQALGRRYRQSWFPTGHQVPMDNPPGSQEHVLKWAQPEDRRLWSSRGEPAKLLTEPTG